MFHVLIDLAIDNPQMKRQPLASPNAFIIRFAFNNPRSIPVPSHPNAALRALNAEYVHDVAQGYRLRRQPVVFASRNSEECTVCSNGYLLCNGTAHGGGALKSPYETLSVKWCNMSLSEQTIEVLWSNARGNAR